MAFKRQHPHYNGLLGARSVPLSAGVITRSAYADRQTRWLGAKEQNLIYDVGMHKGEDTDYYLKKGFKVIGFEADPQLANYCRTRFSSAIERKELRIVEGAIVDQGFPEGRQKTVKFFKNLDNSVWGTVCGDWAQRNEMLGTHNEVIEVEIVDFTECLRQYGIPYYMKIDIEGTDLACLKSLLGFDTKPDYVSIESEKLIFDKLEEEIKLLEQLGYNQFKAIQQENIALQVPPHPSREGKDVSYQFERGSSGLFGKDLPGKWRDSKQILSEYKRIFALYQLFGDYSFLRKFKRGRKFISTLTRTLRRPIPGWYDTHAKHSSADP